MSSIKTSAERLHEALYGKNKDETCLEIVITNNLQQRLEISNMYQELYKKSLYEEIKSKLSGNFKELVGY